MKRKGRSRIAKPRLTAGDWLNVALATLAKDGVAMVSIERLAAKLGVTRGSFYHHFRDRADLLERLLAFWRQGWTGSVKDENRALGLDARTSLLALIHTIRTRKAADYDVAIRAWAVHDPRAAAVVRRVDEERLGYIRGLFAKIGFDALEAENRARLFLYYEMGEPAMFARQGKALEERLLIARYRLLTESAQSARSPNSAESGGGACENDRRTPGTSGARLEKARARA